LRRPTRQNIAALKKFFRPTLDFAPVIEYNRKRNDKRSHIAPPPSVFNDRS